MSTTATTLNTTTLRAAIATVVITASIVSWSLPAFAAPLREACRSMNVAPERVLMVGDSGTDVRAAQAASCAAAVVRYGYSRVPVESLGAAFILDSIADVGALVQA